MRLAYWRLPAGGTKLVLVGDPGRKNVPLVYFGAGSVRVKRVPMAEMAHMRDACETTKASPIRRIMRLARSHGITDSARRALREMKEPHR